MAHSSSWGKQRKRGRRRKWGVLGSIKTWISSMDYCHQIPCLDWGLGGLIQQRAADIIQKAGRIALSNWAHLMWMTENCPTGDFDIMCLRKKQSSINMFALVSEEWEKQQQTKEGNHKTDPKCLFLKCCLHYRVGQIQSNCFVDWMKEGRRREVYKIQKKKSPFKSIAQHLESLIQHNCDKQNTIFKRLLYFLTDRLSVCLSGSLFFCTLKWVRAFQRRGLGKAPTGHPSLDFKETANICPSPFLAPSLSFAATPSLSLFSHLRLINLAS